MELYFGILPKIGANRHGTVFYFYEPFSLVFFVKLELIVMKLYLFL